MSDPVKLIIKNCEQIVQVCADGEPFKRGTDQDRLAVLERNNGIGCSLVIGFDGTIKGQMYPHFNSIPFREMLKLLAHYL